MLKLFETRRERTIEYISIYPPIFTGNGNIIRKQGVYYFIVHCLTPASLLEAGRSYYAKIVIREGGDIALRFILPFVWV